MRRILMAGIVLGLLSSLPAPVQAQGGDVYDVSVFYRPLSPYGEWINIPPFGWVWSPYDVAPDWRPYTVGRWVWTDCGWTWVSFEPWGWATDHYGRWYFDPYYGWVWVPGTDWGPAWVAWRYGGGWIGWAPLPPAYTFRPGASFSNPTTLGPQAFRRFAWSFVEVNQFCNPNVRPYIARSVRNVNIIDQTRDVTQYDYMANRWINRGVDVRTIEKSTRQPVPNYRVVGSDRMVGKNGFDFGGKDLRIYKPRVNDAKGQKIAPPMTPGKKPTAITTDFSSKQTAEQQALEKRLAAERAALTDRQQREAVRLSRVMTPDQLKKWQAREIEAFNDKAARERNLLTRYHDREKSGNVGVGDPQARKFNILNPMVPTNQTNQQNSTNPPGKGK